MTILEQIISMKRQGISDEQIIEELSQQGASPREINDGLRQAQIKYAVSDTEEYPEGEIPTPGQNGYSKSGNYNAPQQDYSSQEYPPQEQYAAPEQQYYPATGYDASSQGGGIDTDTIMEVADQIFSDRIKKIQKQVEGLTEISSILQTKMENMSDRLKKIENIIDKLQISILEKVGSYGGNLESIKKEMSMMQDSFSKMVTPKESRRYSEQSEEETVRKASRKK